MSAVVCSHGISRLDNTASTGYDVYREWLVNFSICCYTRLLEKTIALTINPRDMDQDKDAVEADNPPVSQHVHS